MKKIIKSLIVMGTITISLQAHSVELAPLSSVKITSGPFKEAEQTNRQYLLALDAEKLLAPFRREAGLPHGDSYGNWENSGLDGHIGGHYLSALALMYAPTGDTEVLKRLNYFVGELKKCQDKAGTGYVAGIPKSKEIWGKVRTGQIGADGFSVNGAWVPWYNMHKTFAGLIDVYKYTGNETAKQVVIKLADWTLELSNHLTEEQMQKMLRTEHGGMNDALADVAQLTNDKKYLTLAQRFSHQDILHPLEKQKDELTGKHANTQIPKIIGFKKIGDETRNAEWQNAAEFFWQTVVSKRSVAIGGNSVKEHFNDRNDFHSMIDEIEGPETCNTYNMLKLTELLFKSDPQVKYADYYERALYNHILSSQNPDTGGLVYFTPMRPNHFRVYSQVQQAMWCCVGSGIESQSKYGEFIYARDASEKGNPQVFVNLFIASTMQWKEQGIFLSQATLFPDEESTKITLGSNKTFSLNIRYPSWVAENELKIRVNGKAIEVPGKPGFFVRVNRKWKKGDVVEVSLPMRNSLEQLPDGSQYFAILHGPIVLAAKTQPFKNETLNYLADDSRMGHVAAKGQQCPLEAAPFLLGNSNDFIQKLKPVSGKPLTFSASGLINGKDVENLELIPFFRLHNSRYTIYWPASTPENVAQARAKIGQDEKARVALLAATIDSVSPGEQQPESDHFYKGEASELGIFMGKHWRQSSQWFSYELNDKKGEAKLLQITLSKADVGRHFSIWINGRRLTTVKTKEEKENFYDLNFVIPGEFLKDKPKKLIVKFVAEPGSVAGRLYGLRLLRKDLLH